MQGELLAQELLTTHILNSCSQIATSPLAAADRMVLHGYSAPEPKTLILCDLLLRIQEPSWLDPHTAPFAVTGD